MALKRRDFLKLIGATTVATTLPGCGPEKPRSLLPYVIPQEEIIPGRSVWYASVCRECPAGCGITVRVREGRATKVEGNALHPVNAGALCARGQASLQGLYNPDRLQAPMRKAASGKWETLSWKDAEEFLVSRVREILAKGKGKDIVWMTPQVSGSIDALIGEWLAALGSGKRYRYEALNDEALSAAHLRLFGTPEIPVYDFGAAETVYSFGTDFLETWRSPVGFGNGFSRGRGEHEGRPRTSFTYLGPRLSMTASNADHWVNVHADMLGVLALAMVRVILDEGLARVPSPERGRVASLVKEYAPDQVSWATGLPVERIIELARGFGASGMAIAVAGGPVISGEFGAQTAAAAALLNYVTGNIGRTVHFSGGSSRPAENSYAECDRLARDMEKDLVPALFLTEVNPVYSMPASSGFAAALAKVPLVVAFSTMMDETSAQATLVLPVHSPLESWGDYEPRPGVHGLMQPAMEPVFPTRMLGDILLETGRSLFNPHAFESPSFHEYVKDRWRGLHARLTKKPPAGTPVQSRGHGGPRYRETQVPANFEAFWVESLARGGVWESLGDTPVKLSQTLTATAIAGPKSAPPRGGTTFTLLTYPSIAHYDGRGANKPWLQELPDPMTRLVWGSWVEIGPEDAARLGIANGDRVQVSSSYGRCELPAHIMRGLRQGCVAIPLGQGHTAFGRYADGNGINAYTLLDPKPSADGSGGMMWSGTSVDILKLPGVLPSASVQEAESQEDRGILQEIPAALVAAAPEPEKSEEPSLYPEQEYQRHHWGMVIDADKCTGCSACVTACYAENNIPVVGRDEVINGREMAWIRIDRYYAETPDAPQGRASERAGFLPMLCQQCGMAPCETVCPVYAAYHTDEGLNGQVYNRCIGTRYCANNCPYKVRRFNWFDHDLPEPLNWQLNPDVTVRSKGVMEKCTFCVQRIVEGKNNARRERRPLMDGEVRTACQQSCPAQAIVFGDLKDPESAVSKLSAANEPRPYHVLEELNTKPAVTYLKRIRS